MKEIYIVVRPDMNSDVSFGGAFSNLDAAKKCATDPDLDYEGYIWTVDLAQVKDDYISESEDDEEE
jgi:hypothetical protein